MVDKKFVQGSLVILSGPSGSGKGTVLRQLLAHSPVPLTLATSACTRQPRPGEVDGLDYYFLSREEFEQKCNRGDFLEWVQLFGNYYGTLRSEVEHRLALGQWVILEIDVQGCRTLHTDYPDAVTIFLKTPSMEEYERRLRKRATENEETLQDRLKTAAKELRLAHHYRYQVVNDDIEHAVDEIRNILQSVGDTSS